MKIGFHSDIFTYSSEALGWLNIAREWIKDGHEVHIKDFNRHYFARNVVDITTEYPEVAARVSDNPPPVDVYFNFCDLIAQNVAHIPSKVHANILSWGLFPLDSNFVQKVQDPIFIPGKDAFSRLKHIPDTYLFESGVDRGIFYPQNTIVPKKTEFLWIGVTAAASCPDTVIEAFIQEFWKDNTARLTLISPTKAIQNLVNCICRDQENIVCITSPISQRAIAEYLRNSTALIQPIRFHTECRPIMEAMACGCPVVTTCYGAGKNYFGDTEQFYISYEEVKAIQQSRVLRDRYIGNMATNEFCEPLDTLGFKWAEPEVEHLRRIMRDIHEGPFNLDAIATQNLRLIAPYTWKKTADNLINVVTTYLEKR